MNAKSEGFTWVKEGIHLPQGAWARTERHMLHWQGRPVLGLTAGEPRPSLFPVYSPAGHLVTAEAPADHPHHRSIWIAADHVNLLMPIDGGGHEIYAYNFYVDEIFQGRAPARIVQASLEGSAHDADSFVILQNLQWVGPREWGAPDGRALLREERRWTVYPGERHHVIDVSSVLRTTQWAVEIGPTRHAYFNARVSEPMRVLSGGRLIGAGGLEGAEAISGSQARWVDASGPVGREWAGVALGPRTLPRTPWWFVSDWGVLTLNAFRTQPLLLPVGGSARLEARYVVHDGPADPGLLDRLFEPGQDSACT